jgi:hypothetical protein
VSRFEFTAETNILDALDLDPRVVECFRRLGLRCWPARDAEPCIASEKETLAEAALYHDLDLAALLRELNALDIARPPAEPEA